MLRYNYTESNELGKRLRRVRKAAGMTLQDLSDALNLEYGTHANKGTISKYENGIHEPNASTIFCIAQIIGVSVDYLMGKTDMDYPSLLAVIEAKKQSSEQADAEAAAAAVSGAGPAIEETVEQLTLQTAANYSFDVLDNSMSPHYRIGDVLIIRTGMPLVESQIYLVQYKRSKPMVRQLIMEKKKWILKTENRAFDTTEIPVSEDLAIPAGLKVIGRVIEFRRSEI
jgi:transcriptional regulator with XRE-family HTH domain